MGKSRKATQVCFSHHLAVTHPMLPTLLEGVAVQTVGSFWAKVAPMWVRGQRRSRTWETCKHTLHRRRLLRKWEHAQSSASG